MHFDREWVKGYPEVVEDLSGAALAEVLEKLTLLLTPFVPYLTQEMWEELGRTGPVFRQAWPPFDPELAHPVRRLEGAERAAGSGGR
jgi:leucyl-tRNA synthetase